MDQIKYSIFSQNVSDEWDQFVLSTSGGTLHSRREFLNYHKEKFEDLSFIFTLDNEIVAVLAAAVLNDKLVSHPGASYGGLIYKQNLKLEQVSEIKNIIYQECKVRKLNELEIRFPYSIMSKNYFDKFKYVTNSETTKVFKEISQYIPLDELDNTKYSKNFIRILKKNKNFHTVQSLEKKDIINFYKILEKNLVKHDTKPTHSIEELNYLIENLNDDFDLFVTKNLEGKIISASLVMKLDSKTVHSFYFCTDYDFIKSSPLINTIDFIAYKYKSLGFKNYSLGISTEKKGMVVNGNLNSFKEKFNTLATIRETYLIKIP